VGGLASYGPSADESFRRAASYVDKILRGAKPGELPVEQPTKFELAINMKVAKALGLTIPSSLVGGADEVVQSRSGEGFRPTILIRSAGADTCGSALRARGGQ